jgi:hypothetical protein
MAWDKRVDEMEEWRRGAWLDGYSKFASERVQSANAECEGNADTYRSGAFAMIVEE